MTIIIMNMNIHTNMNMIWLLYFLCDFCCHSILRDLKDRFNYYLYFTKWFVFKEMDCYMYVTCVMNFAKRYVYILFVWSNRKVNASCWVTCCTLHDVYVSIKKKLIMIILRLTSSESWRCSIGGVLNYKKMLFHFGPFRAVYVFMIPCIYVSKVSWLWCIFLWIWSIYPGFGALQVYPWML